jgi:pimeloyl-ACP methyl ester carboxylesterase
MRAMTVPTSSSPATRPLPGALSVLMKREIPSAALAVMPNCGHTINLEDPDLFNRIVGDFIVRSIGPLGPSATRGLWARRHGMR